MPRIWLYRHAQSLSNAGERTSDVTLIPLSAKGRVQADAMAAGIEATPDGIVTSAFLRSIQTAAPVMDRFPTVMSDIWPIHEFTYLDPAACVGTSWIERKPMVEAYWARLDPDHVDGEGAESFRDLLARARAFLDRLATTQAPLTLIVSHGQFMQAARLLAETPDLPARDAMAAFRDAEAQAPFANCERLQLAADAGRVRVERRG